MFVKYESTVMALLCLKNSLAYPMGAGHCEQGDYSGKNTFGNHVLPGRGSLEENSLEISFGGVVLPTESTFDLKANQEYTVRIETTNAAGFKGFLVRAEGMNAEDLSSSFTGENDDVQIKEGCDDGIAAMTHKDNSLKTFVEFTFFHPTPVPELRLDVTVVRSGGGQNGNWSYSLHALSVCAPDTPAGTFSLKKNKAGNVVSRSCEWLQGKSAAKQEKFCTKAKFQRYNKKTFPASRYCPTTCCGYCAQESNFARFIVGTKVNGAGVTVAQTKNCGWLKKQEFGDSVAYCANTVDFDTMYGQCSEICPNACAEICLGTGTCNTVCTPTGKRDTNTQSA